MAASSFRKDLPKIVIVGEESEHVEGKKNKISGFRIILPQFLACTAKNLVLVSLAMVMRYPTIAIPVLLEPTIGLKFTKEQASWFGSIVYICQPVGSIVSGFTSQAWGRKTTLILVNIPFIVGWFLMYTAYDLYQLFAATIILGFAMGFTQGPALNYMAEICQPKWRGILANYSQIFIGVGFFLMSLIGSLTDWHTAAAISSSVSILAIISIVFVPESPAWLIFKGREDDAQKSLCWFRGWVKPEEVQQEFQKMVEFNKALPQLKQPSSEEPKTLMGKILGFLGLRDLFNNEILRPFILVNIFLFFQSIAGIVGTHAYIIEIFEEFRSPMDPFWAAVIESSLGIAAHLLGCLTVAKIGKRVICHISFLGGASCCILISIYGFSVVENDASWIPVTLYCLFSFFHAYGIGLVPWIYVTEVFPIRGRSMASGISSALSYLMYFLVIKTYYNLVSAFTLPGSFLFYGVAMIIGWFFFYFFIPETEGETLEKVQNMFANVWKKQDHQCRPGKECPRLSAVSLGRSRY